MSKRNAVLVIACACLSAVRCEPPSSQYGTPLGAPINNYNAGGSNYNNGGNNHHDHNEYGEPKAYEFGYQVKDDYTGNNYDRKEQSDGNQVRGEYRVQLPDGRTQIVTYYADWQSGFHADVRYEGEPHYPDQYNVGGFAGGYNTPSNQYGAPAGGHGGDISGGYHGGYNNGGGTSSVSIKDYSSGSTPYNTGGYNQGGSGGYSGNQGYHNFNGGYDSYNGGFGNKGRPTPEYGAP